MKKIFVALFALLLISQVSYAQWSTGSGYIYPTILTDKLSIGVTSATAKTDILSTTEQLRLLYNSTNYVSHTVSAGGNYIITPTGPRFVVSGDLVMGIGVAVPQSILHAHRTGSNASQIRVTNDNTGSGSGDGFVIGYPSTVLDVTIQNRENGGIIFYSNDISRGKLDAAGNWGFGETTPTAKVHITSNSNDNQSALFVNGGGNATGEHVGYFLAKSGSNFAADVIRLAANRTSNTAYNFINAIVDEDGTPSTAFLVRGDGRVGIGTKSPDESLTVNGKIHAKEVRIDTSIPTPDYVFNKDYDLLSLADVKNYINKNHHLPEVPSAAEVEKNGLKLGEMNLILLKKVEELTLHLIEKDKQLEDQNTKLEQQNKQLKQQQEDIDLLKQYIKK